MATVFLNDARYSLGREEKRRQKGKKRERGREEEKEIQFSSVCYSSQTYDSSSCFILVYSSFVILSSPTVQTHLFHI